MKQVIASMFSDIYTIGNTIFCIFKYIAAVYKLRLSEVNFLYYFGLPKLTSFINTNRTTLTYSCQRTWSEK